MRLLLLFDQFDGVFYVHFQKFASGAYRLLCNFTDFQNLKNFLPKICELFEISKKWLQLSTRKNL